MKKKKKTAPRRQATPRVVIVGFGRVGGAIALGLREAGWDVAVLPRSADSVRKAASLRVFLADHDDLRAAQLCILAVPDSAVVPAMELVEEDLGPSTALVHCSGALPLATFATARTRRPVGSFHPLAAISDPKDSLSGHTVALASTDRTLHANLERMAAALGMSPLEVPETGRTAYHAGAVLSAGLLVALLDGAVSALEEAGLHRDVAIKALLPLSASALRGVSSRGLEKGLTGPVVRGDVGVVQAHLESLPPELGSLYRLLSRRALRLTPALPPETRLALERLLA
ncbi:MAG: DUF2520 domain-containing protein [Archangium sp.]|nr:DUF2520 domain-containing protein [Archangium sp.]